MTDREFLGVLRDEHRGVLVRLSLVDVADGDFVAGALLSQILYWYANAHDGHPRGSVEREGRIWLVRRRTDWYREIRLGAREVDRAMRVLVANGCVLTRLWKGPSGEPTTHIWPDIPAIARNYGLVISNSPNGEMEFPDRGEPWISPNGEMELTDRGNHPSKTGSEDHVDFPEEPDAHKTRGSAPSRKVSLEDVDPAVIEAAITSLRAHGTPVKNPATRAARAMILAEVLRQEAAP